MVPPVIAEQQAKLGVSAEESKAQRLQRQQARFRDRGGAFVPSNSNPLIDILLARTVSGESPSKAPPKEVTAERRLSSKARRTSPTRKASAVTTSNESQGVAGSSKSKLPASRKRKKKSVDLKADTTAKPAPKRRGKKKAPEGESDIVKRPSKAKSKPTPKKKSKHDSSTASSSVRNSKPKPKTKSNLAKAVAEVLVSDDDRTLVEVPRKSKSNSKRGIRHEDGETDDDAPIVKKRALPPIDNSQAPSTKTALRIKAEKTTDIGASGKRIEDVDTTAQVEKRPKTNAKKRPVPHHDDDVAAPVPKKGKPTNSTSVKPKSAIGHESAPRTTMDARIQEKSKATGNEKEKSRSEPDQDIAEPVEDDDDERPPRRTSKLNKRKKEDDNYDDRPRKAVKFSDTGLPHSSSQKLKENQSDGEHKSIVKSRIKDESYAPPLKLVTKPPSCTKKSKGPPLEVLERIKASAARHFQCADSEPDELDCLS